MSEGRVQQLEQPFSTTLEQNRTLQGIAENSSTDLVTVHAFREYPEQADPVLAGPTTDPADAVWVNPDGTTEPG